VSVAKPMNSELFLQLASLRSQLICRAVRPRGRKWGP